MRVKDCMCKKVIKTNSDITLKEVAKLMEENDIGVIPVCNQENNVIGCVTDRDIITRCIATDKDCNTTKVSEIMTKKVIKVTPDTDISDAIETMSTNQIKRLPVIENNEIVGILSIGDLAQNNHISSKEVGNTVECICSENNN